MELEIRTIKRTYGKKIVLDNISFTLKPGIYGLLGANGAGKSTLLKVICGVIKASEGSVIYNGRATIESGAKFRSVLGFLPQEFRYYPEFTGLKFLLYLSALKGVNKNSARKKCLKLLKTVGLDEVKDKKIKTYSGGMKQRLGIAQALINDPEVIILDEPTVGLDPKERIKFRNLLSSFSEKKIVILSTHIVSDVEYIADEILIMKQGKLEDRGDALALLKKICDQVWECPVSPDLVPHFLSHYTVSNQKHEGNAIILRIISREKPTEKATLVTPTLEELYLYYFREEGSL